MKQFIFVLMVGLSAGVAQSQDETETTKVPALRINPVTIGAEQLKMKAQGQGERLRFREIEALELSREWQDKYSKPLIGEGGRVVYHFGETIHTVVCSPLNVCDIELQAGEVMRPPQIGDNIRWVITPGISGQAPNQIPHIFVKAKQENLNTTLIVPTDRRTYHFQLKSTPKEYMAIVSFTYGDETQAEWIAYQLATQQKQEDNSIQVEGVSWQLDSLDFNYRIEGDTPKWTPVRVFNNGLKTVIQMPFGMKQTEAPAFLALDESGDEQIVNYRVRNDRFIVDRVFDRGILITGVGRKQTRVTIFRKEAHNKRAEIIRDENR